MEENVVKKIALEAVEKMATKVLKKKTPCPYCQTEMVRQIQAIAHQVPLKCRDCQFEAIPWFGR